MGGFLKNFLRLMTVIQIQIPYQQVMSIPKQHFGSCIAGTYGPGYFTYLEECPLFQTLALQSYSNTIYPGRLIYCCPDEQTHYDDILPHAPLCGTMLSRRIVGGTDTSIDEFPWTVRIKYLNKQHKISFLCGGSLISSRWVLTAAHCVTGHELRDSRVIGVRLGEWHTATNPDCEFDIRGFRDCAPPHIDVNIDRILPHETYDSLRRFADDIALLRLLKAVDFSDFIKPICLPIDQSLYNDELVSGMAADVTGWGRSTANTSHSLIKQKVTLKLQPLEACQVTYAPWHLQINEMQLCAGGEVTGVDTCRGDSGGPLMYETKNERSMAFYYIAGIVSYGKTICGHSNQPSVYTRVSAYMHWIVQKIHENL